MTHFGGEFLQVFNMQEINTKFFLGKSLVSKSCILKTCTKRVIMKTYERQSRQKHIE